MYLKDNNLLVRLDRILLQYVIVYWIQFFWRCQTNRVEIWIWSVIGKPVLNPSFLLAQVLRKMVFFTYLNLSLLQKVQLVWTRLIAHPDSLGT